MSLLKECTDHTPGSQRQLSQSEVCANLCLLQFEYSYVYDRLNHLQIDVLRALIWSFGGKFGEYL